jgi:flagellar basal body-associated protein FliL
VSVSVTGPSPNRNMFRAIAIGLLVVAVACAAVAIYWLTVKSTFLASHYGHQPKHALVAGIVAVVALIAASIVWRQGRQTA